MFTGLIEATVGVLDQKKGVLRVERPASFDDIRIGSSIAVSGVCLTVTALDDRSMTFQMVEETLKRSKLGSLKIGNRVNLERAMKAGDRLDGHVVQGHVEGTGKVVSVSSSPAIQPPPPAPPPHEIIETSAASADHDLLERAGEGGMQTRVVRGFGKHKYPPKIVVGHARFMRKNPTEAEKIFWKAVRGRRLEGYYFRRQRPVGASILDFYCEELKLGIEIDGDIHLERQEYDQERTEILMHRGIRLLRFSNQEVMEQLPAVLKKIIETAHSPPPLVSENYSLQQRSPSKKEDAGEGLGVGAVSAEGGRGGEGTPEEGLGLPAVAPPCGAKVGVEEVEESVLLQISLPSDLAKNILPKGSITLDGISLTVVSIEGNLCSIALIPHTLAQTTLSSLRVGDIVNVETDIYVRTIAATLSPRA